ncbi:MULTISPECIES: hypothetical protein [Rhodopseudomonas]|uniref:hypothetical protein n=1 Tax=Rhodopseudomonas TaxID=1073 RepID=UPI000697A47A|nr:MULTISPECIES: hypothetical protein [Rhodopseudomonas]MDF3812927.1 hypothetical protein [Rhodopseudomonas sp. BAL398]WOK16010.1 hypothetical protein RBJ75_17765 [Rhodopseudomonas sp. BAL398]
MAQFGIDRLGIEMSGISDDGFFSSLPISLTRPGFVFGGGGDAACWAGSAAGGAGCARADCGRPSIAINAAALARSGSRANRGAVKANMAAP